MLFKNKKLAPPANGGALVPKFPKLQSSDNFMVQAKSALEMMANQIMIGSMFTEEVMDIPIDLNGLWKDEEHGAIVSLFDSPRKRKVKLSGGRYHFSRMSEILKAGFVLSVPNEGFCRAATGQFVLSSIMPKREFKVLVVCQHFKSEETGILELSVLEPTH